ncbi:MAG: hypothetical protein IKE62_00330 [Oscillospiraceae bacterium]|nr:hypothetical protein [Oscillospiraceae bacterium]
MLNKIFSNKLVVFILAFIMACLLWGYVSNVVNIEIDVKINNIQVTFDGEEDLRDKRTLQIIESKVEDVDLTFTGKRSEVTKLTRENVSAVVDLHSIRSSGEYSMAYSVVLPDTVSENSVTISRNPYYVQITVAKMVTAQVPVTGELVGSVAENCIKGEYEFTPAYISVSGPDSVVGSIVKAVVTVRGDDLSKSVSATSDYVLTDALGENVDMSDISVDYEEVETFMPVYQIKDVPLSVRFIEGNGITTGDITWTVEPTTVKVYAYAEELDGINEFVLPTIDLTGMLASEDFTFPIPVSNNVTNLSGEETAVVRVKIVGVASKTVTATNFVVTNVPEGYYAEVARSSLPVTVRAPKEQIDYIDSNNVRVVLDMSGAGAYSGNQLVTAAVMIDGFEDAGAVGEYTVAVTLTEMSAVQSSASASPSPSVE